MRSEEHLCLGSICHRIFHHGECGTSMVKNVLTALAFCAILMPVNAKEVHRIKLEIFFVKDIKEIPVVNKHGMKHGQLGVAYPPTKENGGVCTIVVQKPREGIDYERQEILGHEIRHCYDGNFH